MDDEVSNWVAVHRRILDSAVASEDELLGLFTRVLLCVNWKAGQFKGYHVQPGQLIFAWRKLRDRLYPTAVDGPSKNTIEKRLRCLESLGVITIRAHESRRFSVLSVPNWSKYQPSKAYQKLGTSSKESPPKTGTLDCQLPPESGTVLGTVFGTDRISDNKENNSSLVREEIQQVFSLWNDTAARSAGCLSAALKLTEGRKQKIAVRLKDPEWIAAFKEAIKRLPLPTGPGMRWQPDFDWALANETNVLKVVEGKYDWRADRSEQPSAQERRQLVPKRRLQEVRQ